MPPSLQGHISWLVIGWLPTPVPAHVVADPEWGYVASSADWRIARRGEGPCEALCALAEAIEERIHHAMVASRTAAQLGERASA